jgi:acyl-CoA thioesterase-1
MNRQYGGRWARLQRGLLALALAVLALPALAASGVAPAATPERTILVLGDSLSAGYGLANGEGWVALTARRLPATHPGWRIVNASISGETSAGGAARIGAELARHHPRIVLLELGANDGLRGLELGQMRANLERIVQASQQSGAQVLLVGMRMPPNFGPRYTSGFEQVYAGIAERYRTGFLPFLLAPLAADRANFQQDNLHPVAAAQPRLRDHVWSQLRPLLNAASAAPSTVPSASARAAASKATAPPARRRASAAHGSGG